MLILSLDTTNEHGGAEVYRDAQPLASAANEGPADYSVKLFEMADRLMADAHITLRDIELFAVANGPGSFTGIRVGVAAVQGWASAFHRPVCGVSILEAMVETARPATAWAAPLFDARRGEFYVAAFRQAAGSGQRYVQEGEGRALKPAALAQFIEQLPASANATLACIRRDYDMAAQSVAKTLLPWLGWCTVQGTLTAAIARLALRASQEGRLLSPRELDAVYIRRSDAELHWNED